MGNKVINTTSVKLGMYDTSTDSQLIGMLGDVKEMEDGRKFRLCKNGSTTALVAGILIQAVVGDTGYNATLTIGTIAAGASEIEVTLPSSPCAGYSVGDLASGFLVVDTGGSGIGQCYMIKTNDAIAADGTGTIVIYDKFSTALTASTHYVTLYPCPYNGTVKDADSAPLLGVPLVAVSASEYFWCLVAGFGPATDSGSGITAGDFVTNVTGDVVTFAGTETTPVIGQAATSTESGNLALVVKYFGLE